MSPALILTLILASLLAMLPIRRLQQANWSRGALLTAWATYLVLILVGLEAGGLARYILPVLVVLFVAPYAAGQARLEKVGRLLGAHQEPVRPVINVTPPTSPGLADPTPPPAPKPRGRKPPTEFR